MFATLRNAWKIPDLKKKLLFTLLIIVLYRLGCAIPIPYTSQSALASVNALNTGIFQYLNILTGSAISHATLFALGINPYITASIVMQLLTIAIPALEKLSKEGEEGQKKINQYTRYVTVALGLISAFGYYKLLDSNGVIIAGQANGFFRGAVVVITYCAGSALVMWLAEKVNDGGIGNTRRQDVKTSAARFSRSSGKGRGGLYNVKNWKSSDHGSRRRYRKCWRQQRNHRQGSEGRTYLQGPRSDDRQGRRSRRQREPSR